MLEDLEAISSEDLRAFFCILLNKQAAMHKQLAHAFDCGDVLGVEQSEGAEQELLRDIELLVKELRERGKPWWNWEDEEAWSSWKVTSSPTPADVPE
jgi:hypothetical protein